MDWIITVYAPCDTSPFCNSAMYGFIYTADASEYSTSSLAIRGMFENLTEEKFNELCSCAAAREFTFGCSIKIARKYLNSYKETGENEATDDINESEETDEETDDINESEETDEETDVIDCDIIKEYLEDARRYRRYASEHLPIVIPFDEIDFDISRDILIDHYEYYIHLLESKNLLKCHKQHKSSFISFTVSDK